MFAVVTVPWPVWTWGAVTTINGTEQTKDGLFELRRLRIRGEWSLETFIAVVTGS